MPQWRWAETCLLVQSYLTYKDTYIRNEHKHFRMAVHTYILYVCARKVRALTIKRVISDEGDGPGHTYILNRIKKCIRPSIQNIQLCTQMHIRIHSLRHITAISLCECRCMYARMYVPLQICNNYISYHVRRDDQILQRIAIIECAICNRQHRGGNGHTGQCSVS